MNAIVCDCCGKVVLLEDEKPCLKPKGISRLQSDILPDGVLDMCDECVEKLLKKVRK